MAAGPFSRAGWQGASAACYHSAMTDQLSDPKALLKSSPVICMAPWVHAHLTSLGHFSPCCEILDPFGDRDGVTLESHWNSPAMASFRNTLLAGEPASICAKCYDKESAGVTSWRQWFNNRFQDMAERLGATAPDGTLPATVQPVDLDLRFSNLCNFRCRSCWHGASSRWFADARALGWEAGPAPVIATGADRPKTLEQVMALLPRVRSIYFAGGEPLLMEEHYAMLAELVRLGRRDVRLAYNTNLSELSLGEHSVLDLWRHFANVQVGASADGMGAVGELVRKGMDWPRFEENVRAVRASCPHVDLSLAITVSVLNVFHLPDFYRHVHEAIGLPHKAIGMKPLQMGLHYNTQMLPRSMKQAAARKLEELARSIPDLGEEAGADYEWRSLSGRRAVEEIISYMFARDLGEQAANFVYITERLDRLRGEDTYAVIPELAPLRRRANWVRIRRRVRNLVKRMAG